MDQLTTDKMGNESQHAISIDDIKVSVEKTYTSPVTVHPVVSFYSILIVFRQQITRKSI